MFCGVIQMADQPEQGKQGPLYGRAWKIVIYKKGEEGSGEDTEMDVSLLRCIFKCQYTMGTASTLGTLIVYNMNVRTEKETIEEGFQIRVEAGYEMGQYGEIFTGDIVQIIRNRENGTDYRLEILAIRSVGVFDVNHVRATIAANSTPRDVVETVAKQADTPIEVGEISEKLPDTPLPRGKVLFGKPSTYLRDICKWNNAWFSQNTDRKLEVHTLTDEIKDDQVLELTPNTGLVGTPKYTDQGINIRMLLDPRVKVTNSSGTLIKIDNEIIQRQLISINSNPDQQGKSNQPDQKSQFDEDGEYMVISVTHSLDTYGDEWTTECNALSRNGKAGLVTAMQNEKQNIRG